MRNGYNLSVIPAGIGSTFQWYKDGQLIPNANSFNYTASLFGNYMVRETLNTCSVFSNQLTVSAFTNTDDMSVRIFPNPVNNKLFAQTKTSAVFITLVKIYDAKGSLVFIKLYNNSNTLEIDVSELAKGTYLVQLETTTNTVSKKIIKQ